MLRNQIYYAVKPFVPNFLRMAVRRNLARRKRKKVTDVWPILPGSERQPADWPGWPQGKQFAFVLTHDVERVQGVNNTAGVCALEQEMGFRSSFNFIPEGSYETPVKLREELTRQGFEVGVHDLEHDGLLYQSRERFAHNAARINKYLRDWNAAGFRSGFMLHNLRWIHDLDICYDASTFDTDPFEPQPEGVHTIFPFWVPSPSDAIDTVPSARGGYVELPYTLPQDSTLFLLFGEQTADMWIKKLDWIASHKGMALVNIHPDYIDFEGNGSRTKYPIARLRELLAHVSSKYGDRCWNPCAKELAAWYVAANPPAVREPVETLPAEVELTNLRRKRVAVLLYSHYPADPRPRRAAEALIEAGMDVELICLQEKDDQPRHEVINGVNVLRVPMRKRRGSRLAYITLYGQFILYAFALLAWRGLRRRYDLVHVHNMPDVLALSALLPKLGGARVILDLHDPMPELMMSIYQLPSNHAFVRFLRRLEGWSIGFADLALTPNLSFKRLFISRGCRAEKMQIVMNTPEEKIFDPEQIPPGNEGTPAKDATEFRLMHHGSIVHRHGVDLLVRAVAKVHAQLPGVRLDIYGSPTPFLKVVLDTARELGIGHCVHTHGSKSQEEIACAIRECHLGIVPNRRSAFTELNLPTRLFEYISLGRPVIAPSTQGIRDYFNTEQIVMFDPDNVDDLAAKILWVHAQPMDVHAMVDRGAEIYQRHRWQGEKARFLKHVAALLNGGQARLAS